MPVRARLWASPSGTKNVAQSGFGGGQYLLEANLFSGPYSSYTSGSSLATRSPSWPAASTADYYHTDGLTDPSPYDLLSMGSWGANIAATEGYRYVWFIADDHGSLGPGVDPGWLYDGVHIYAGFSNDPRIPPEPTTLRAVINGKSFTVPGVTCTFFTGFQARLVYNPDDPTTPAYLYCGSCMSSGATGGAPPTNSLNVCLFKNSDFNSEFTPVSVSHACTGGFGLTSYQEVYRLGTGNWVSWGGGSTTRNFGEVAKWTSTDGVTFTLGAITPKTLGPLGAMNYPDRGWIKTETCNQRFQIGSQWYLVSAEDRRSGGWNSSSTYAINEQVNLNDNQTYKSLQNSNTNNNPATSPAWWQPLGVLGQYIQLVPVDGTTGDVNFTGTPPFIQISDVYNGDYPNSDYLQYVKLYIEDGIAFIYAVHGMFGNTGLGAGEPLPENGGGINEQYLDIYAYVFDANAAKASAPFAVRASCTSGVVTLTWDNLPAGRTYRVKRGTSFGTYGTTVGDVTGTTISDSPTVGSVYYYQVISLDAGVEQASRVVSTYVS